MISNCLKKAKKKSKTYKKIKNTKFKKCYLISQLWVEIKVKTKKNGNAINL